MKKNLIGASGLVRDFYDWVKGNLNDEGLFFNHSLFRDRFREYLKTIPADNMTYVIPSDRTIKSCICTLESRGAIERIERGIYKIK